MKLNVVNAENKIVETLDVRDDVFGINPNSEALLQYIRVYTQNQRQGTSSTKTRSEVSGGGKKPWKQKGTGRARQGSNRSPIWRHGGVAHGPKPRNYSLQLPKKIAVLATKSALSLQASKGNIIVLDSLSLDKPNTKKLVSILKTLGVTRNGVYVWSKPEPSVAKSLANISSVHMAFAGTLNAYQIVKAKKIVLIKDTLKSLEARYENK